MQQKDEKGEKRDGKSNATKKKTYCLKDTPNGGMYLLKFPGKRAGMASQSLTPLAGGEGPAELHDLP